MPLLQRFLAPAFVLLVALSLKSGVLQAAEVHVSPNGSDLSGDGTPERPFGTITRALAVVAAEKEAVLALGPGIYSPSMTGEPFPIRVKLAGALTLRGPETGGAVLRGTTEEALLRIDLIPGGVPSFRLERVQLDGGKTGVSVVGGDGVRFEAALLGDRFTRQGYQGAEVVAGQGGQGTVSVRGNELDGRAAFGIDLGTRALGVLQLEVVDNRIEDSTTDASTGGSQPLRFGVAVYQDAAASVLGTIDRNRILNVPVGVALVQSEQEGDPGRLSLRVSNCLIAGDASPARNLLRHGLYLRIWPHFQTSLRFLGNTVENARGYGVYQDGLVDFRQREDTTTLVIAGSIFWNAGLGEFSAERDGQDARPLPAYYRRVEHNVLPRSARGNVDGNLTADPRLAPDHSLAADSPALDAWSSPPEPLELDLSGGCRSADGDGDGVYRMDLGALERSGPCLTDARMFLRGDYDGNLTLDITDAVGSFDSLFLGGRVPSCLDACDANDDGDFNITDGIFTLSFLFLGGPAPPAPYPTPGYDPTADRLGYCPR